MDLKNLLASSDRQEILTGKILGLPRCILGAHASQDSIALKNLPEPVRKDSEKDYKAIPIRALIALEILWK